MSTALKVDAERPLAARYEALFGVSQAIRAYRDPAELFRALATELHKVVQFDGIGVVQYDAAGNKTKWHLGVKCPQSEGSAYPELPREETITWWVHENQLPFVTDSTEQETRFPRMMEQLRGYGVRSACVLPLTTAHRRLGCLIVGSGHLAAYSQDEVHFLTVIAQQVAVAMDDALNFEASQRAQAELQREKDRLKLLLDLNNNVVSILDLRELLRAITGSVRRVMECDVVSVDLLDAETNRLRLFVLDFPDSKGFFHEEMLLPVDSAPAKVVATGKPLLLGLPDQSLMNPDLIRRLEGEGIKSACLLPLLNRGRALGVLALASRRENAFTQSDADFLMQVANQIAIAVDNALAYGETAELKEKLETLLDVSDAITVNLDLESLFGELAQRLPRIVPFDFINVVLHDPEGDVMRLRLLIAPEPTTFQIGLGVPVDDSPAGWVWKNQKPLMVEDLALESRFPRLISMLRENRVQSFCSVPLTSARRRLGSMAFGSFVKRAYKDSEIGFMQQVANQVATAVDNALAYSQTAQLKEKLQTLLEVSDAIAVNRHLEELFRDLAQRLPRILQFDIINLVLCDAEAGVVRLQFAIGPHSSAIRPGLEFPIEDSATGLVWKTQEPLVVEDVAKETRFPKLAQLLQETGVQSFCTVPLTSALRRLGAMNFGSLQKRSYQRAEVAFMQQVARQVAIAVDNALAYGQIAELKEKLAQENLYLEDELRTALNFEEFEEIIGKSAALRRVLREVETVAPSDSTVLILGETGSGKELVARAIHDRSARKPHAFVKLNCAAIPTGLLESELFGHEKGAFTGAIAQRVGRFELAHRGTMFLDEVAEIPLELQPKLLRVLQEREFERLGSTRTLQTDARLIAATNRDLQARVDANEFRADLFYRLNVFPIRVPALRERAEDIPVLVRHFTEHFARRMNKSIESIPVETMKALSRYEWPGNVRELQNVIERAVILSNGPVLRVPLADLLRAPVAELKERRPASAVTNGTLEEAERRHILSVLEETKWVLAGVNGAAARLGMKRSTLQFRMQKLGISRPTQQLTHPKTAPQP